MIIPNIWENKIDVPNHQPDNELIVVYNGESRVHDGGFLKWRYPYGWMVYNGEL